MEWTGGISGCGVSVVKGAGGSVRTNGDRQTKVKGSAGRAGTYSKIKRQKERGEEKMEKEKEK